MSPEILAFCYPSPRARITITAISCDPADPATSPEVGVSVSPRVKVRQEPKKGVMGVGGDGWRFF